jgi:hypothetical protein
MSSLIRFKIAVEVICAPERAAREFAQWRAVPDDERSPAPAWWWQPAIDVVAQDDEEMGALFALSTAASSWFDLRRPRRGTDGHAR